MTVLLNPDFILTFFFLEYIFSLPATISSELFRIQTVAPNRRNPDAEKSMDRSIVLGDTDAQATRWKKIWHV